MQNYIPLRIETISPQTPIYFTLYIFFKGQYLQYMEPGSKIDGSKLEKLKNQQVARFLIKEEEQHLYQKYLADLLKQSMSDPALPIDSKVDVVEAAATTAVEGMQQDPSTQTSYKIAQNTAMSLRQIVSENPVALKKIFGKPVQESEQIIKHCLNVSALCASLSDGLGFTEQEIDELCTAALIHDIGVVKLTKEDRKLFLKPRKKFTPDDTRLYSFHVKSAEAMLKEKTWITKNVLDLVTNHEETLSGSGPLRKKKLTLAEEVLSLANCYDKRIITIGGAPKEIFKNLEIEEVGNYNLKLIKHFKKVLEREGMLE